MKSSTAKNKRLTRQKNNLEQTVAFINDGEKMRDGELLKTTNLPIEPQSYMRNVERLLLRATKECILTEKIGDHLILHILDLKAMNPQIDPEPAFAKLKTEIQKWDERGDFILTMESGDRRGYVQNFAPFSVFPLPHNMRAKLMTGALMITAHVNLDEVLRYLSNRGWSVVKGPNELSAEAAEIGEDNDDGEVFAAVLKKGALTVGLPMPIVGRLGHEFLSVKTLGEALDALYSMGPNSADALFLNLDGEASQWD